MSFHLPPHRNRPKCGRQVKLEEYATTDSIKTFLIEIILHLYTTFIILHS